MHRGVAAAIESRDPAAAEENAALIAEHLEAAGDLHAAYSRHMRAASWATNRDIAAAQLSWERAQKIADALPAEDINRAAMRIAPRTMLCGIAFRVHEHVAGERFDELRQLCTAAGDNASLAVGMAGLVMDHAFQGRMREASQLASEAWELAESIGDPTLTVGLSFPLVYAKMESGDWPAALQWSHSVIDQAAGDPSKGNFIFGSPLAAAFATSGLAGYFLGRDGWRDDLARGLALARNADPASYVTVVSWVYNAGIVVGALTPDDGAIGEIEHALRTAERSGDDLALVFSRMTLGHALVHRDTGADHERGQDLLAGVTDAALGRGHYLAELPIVDISVARERASRGDRDEAIPLMRAAVDDLARAGQLMSWGVPATGVLVATLLDRGAESDVVEAESAINRLADAPDDHGVVMRDIWLLRMRALLAQARGEGPAYQDLANRYRAMARKHGFEGHISWGDAMT